MDRDFSQAQESGGSNSQSSASTVTHPGNGMVLHLGVIDIPYANAPAQTKVPQAKKGKQTKPVKAEVENGTQTTGDVAGWLEKKYGVMQEFADAQLPAIAVELEESLAGALESLIMGSPVNSGPFASAESNISQMFKTFLSEGEIEHLGVAGVPTQAALKGVNHRLKINRGAPRPSFLDTGLFQSSFKAWIE